MNPMPEDYEPSDEELVEIERESGLLDAEMALLDAELRILDGDLSEVGWQRLRNAVRDLLHEKTELDDDTDEGDDAA
jgi:hypothetical protein